MKLSEIIKEYPTPFYLYRKKELTAVVDQIRRILPDKGVCFAMKAAPILTPLLSGITDRIEVCSPGEYEICLRAGVSPAKLLISGVNKTREDLLRVLDTAGAAAAFTVESARQLSLLEEAAAERDVSIQVCIRLSSGNQFGVDETQLWELCGRAYQSQRLKLSGLHYYAGTQKQEKRIEKELALLAEIGRKAANENRSKLWLEYGPGLLVDYYAGIDSAPKRERAREEALKMLAGAAEASGIGQYYDLVTFEYGRFIAAWAGDYLTGVADLKKTEKNRYCILDGGLHQLSYFGSMAGMKIPPVKVYDKTGERLMADAKTAPQQEYLLAGSLCSSNDVLARKISLPELSIGDVLRFELAGAYALTESMALFLSRDLPAVLLEDEEKVVLLRRRMLTDGINDGSQIKEVK